MSGTGPTIPPRQSLRAVLVRNTAYNAAGRLWEAAVNIVLAAYIVPRVGLAGWGLWVLVGVFTGYIALLDLGMGSGFARYIAEFNARKEFHRISSVVSTGVFVYFLLGLLLVAGVAPLIDPLIGFLAWMAPGRPGLHDPSFLSEVRFLLVGGVILFACSNCIAPFTAVQTGLQRMGVTNVVSFVASWVKVASIVAFLELGYGVRGLLYAQSVVLAFFACVNAAIAYRLIPGLSVSPRRISRDVFGRLFGYGWKTQVVRLCNVVAFQTDKLVVGAVFGSLDLIGIYRIGEELASKMRQAPVLLLSAIIPAAADLDARGDDDRLRTLYIRSTKYVAAATVPLVCFVAGASGPIIRTWMGGLEHLDMAAWINRIMAVGYLANIMPGAAISIVLGKGRPELQMKAALLEMTANVLLTVALVLTLGFYGVPLGTSLAMFVSCIYVLRGMRRFVAVGALRLARSTLVWPVIAALPGLVACIAADWMTAGAAGRVINAAAVVLSGTALISSYLLVIWRSPFLDAYDKNFFRSAILPAVVLKDEPMPECRT